MNDEMAVNFNHWHRDAASFRDPYGQIWLSDSQVFRILNQSGSENFNIWRTTSCYSELQEQGKLIRSKIVATPEHLKDQASLVLEHPKLELWSYPYEWSFNALRDAALLHLEIQLRALDQNIVLSDASAYNIQFYHAKPLFIDHGAFRPYQMGEYWYGLKQFCEEFLYPLYFSAYTHVPFQSWYRANLSGIHANELWPLIPWRYRRYVHIWKNVFFPAQLGNTPSSKMQQLPPLNRTVYRRLVEKMLHTINTLPTPHFKSYWNDYETTQTYNPEAKKTKLDLLARFVQTYHCQQLLDLGCNTGEYAEAALSAGAATVVGLEHDPACLELAYHKAKQKNLNFIPLYQDLLNPSPTQGFAQEERSGLVQRLQYTDGLIAFACIHHLALPHGINLSEIIRWFLNLAPRGLIEFVDSNDPVVATLLTLPRATPYNLTYFRDLLNQQAKIISETTLPNMERTIFWYERHA